VPGDIVVIDAGDVCPADCRIIKSNKLQVDESSLTGESAPVQKTSAGIDATSILANRTSMLYRSTSVTSGTGSAVVTATGKQTEIGNIASLVAQTNEKPTPLEEKLQILAHKLIWVTLFITATVTLLGSLAGKELALMIETGIALAIAAIPEGLPVVATIALARGMSRMARKNALISRLASVETLGATGVICTDKTGTLTENRMTVVRLVLPDEKYTLSAETDAQSTSEFPLLQADSLSKAANEASYHGDPMEVALLRAGVESRLDRVELNQRQPQVREEAFDVNCRMMATVHQTDGGYRIAVKGAPEEVIAASSMTADGLRVIAVAEKFDSSPSVNVYENLIMIGLVGLHDPPRNDVRNAIKQCRAAGIHIVMMTGDQSATAKQIGKAVSLLDDTDEVIHGSQLVSVNQLVEAEKQKLLSARAFARVSPLQKLELIDMHQQAGQIVAMTGDGVNDAPALEKADIGLVLDHRGSNSRGSRHLFQHKIVRAVPIIMQCQRSHDCGSRCCLRWRIAIAAAANPVFESCHRCVSSTGTGLGYR